MARKSAIKHLKEYNVKKNKEIEKQKLLIKKLMDEIKQKSMDLQILEGKYSKSNKNHCLNHSTSKIDKIQNNINKSIEKEMNFIQHSPLIISNQMKFNKRTPMMHNYLGKYNFASLKNSTHIEDNLYQPHLVYFK